MMGFFGFTKDGGQVAGYIEQVSRYLKLGEGIAFTVWPTRGVVAFFDTASEMKTGEVPVAEFERLLRTEPMSWAGLERARLLLEPVATLEPIMVMRLAQVGGQRPANKGLPEAGTHARGGKPT